VIDPDFRDGDDEAITGSGYENTGDDGWSTCYNITPIISGCDAKGGLKGGSMMD
jgi:hypothetical protein